MDNKIKALEDVITNYQISNEELQLWYEKRQKSDKSLNNAKIQSSLASEKLIPTPRRLIYEDNGNLFVKDGLDTNFKYYVWGIETKRENVFISRVHLDCMLNYASDELISYHLDSLKFNDLPVQQAYFTSDELYLDADFDDTVRILNNHGVEACNCIGQRDWFAYHLLDPFQRMYRSYNYSLGDKRKAIQLPVSTAKNASMQSQLSI